MANICSVGMGIPSNRMTQEKVKSLVQEIFSHSTNDLTRLLPVFDHAAINERQLVVDMNWFKSKHTFAENNHLYQTCSIQLSLEAIDRCLTNEGFLNESIPYEAIDMLTYVSSTGIATPSLDVSLMNERPFRENINRMPLWGLGCAGGAIGLSRAYDYITAHPDKTALIVCCELCSLTFQKEDTKVSNIIGTALFGDGVSAVLLIGDQSPFLSYCKQQTVPHIKKISSFTKKNTESIMGWDVTNDGLSVIFSKQIPELVQTLWHDHIHHFLQTINMNKEQIHSFIAHPGGKKVLDAMESTLAIPKEKLIHSYNVLANHGNMSSATVFYVLHEWLKEGVDKNSFSILSALGPGFSSELLLLEWKEL